MCKLLDVPYSFTPKKNQNGGITVAVAHGEQANTAKLEWRAQEIVVHGMLFSGHAFVALRALRVLGGTYPPLVGDGHNLNYGEAWLGILGEGGEWIFSYADREFTLWKPLLDSIVEDAQGVPEQSRQLLLELDEILWDQDQYHAEIEPVANALELCQGAVFSSKIDGGHVLLATTRLVAFLREGLEAGYTLVEISVN